MPISLPFDNSYARLPEHFFARLEPVPVKAPRLLRLNAPLARALGLDPEALATPEGIDVLAGRMPPDGGAPLAAAYAGHQFGHFNPQLGDGRAILLGEIVAPGGKRFDVQLKGSGRTPFSRGGDGRAAIGPVLREYLISEAMAALGIPTTRTLAAVATGEWIMREEPLPGAVMTRIAASHIRVGTFQFFAARGDMDSVRLLADHAIARHYPELNGAERPYFAFFEAVMRRQASLVAQWMCVGFIHGVMNTDNMAISGETIDYGPCAFMDRYDPETVFSSIDRGGRYAYANQPAIARWNLARLAETLLLLFDADDDKALALANGAIEAFGDVFEAEFTGRLGRKIGLTEMRPGDAELVRDFLRLMQAGQADFTLAFRRLADAVAPSDEERFRSAFGPVFGLDEWLGRWRARLALEGRPASDIAAGMNAENPAVIPRNHRVEEALAAASAEEPDLAPFEKLLAMLARPYAADEAAEAFLSPPPPGGAAYVTFCGT
ncbi:MAG: protein adenylyltransferase SelO [Beijerinckiaceae bacterium]